MVAKQENKKVISSEKRIRPLLLPLDIENMVKIYLVKMRENGGIVTSRIIRIVALSICQSKAPSILKLNGGYTDISSFRAYNFANRHGFVIRKATKFTKAEIENKENVCAEFQAEFIKLIQNLKVPYELIINWDETGIQLLPTASYTFDKQGTIYEYRINLKLIYYLVAKQVPVAHKEDKREITIVLASTRAGTLLSPQLLYAGKTDQVHPTFRFPDGWNVFHTDRHWATTESTKRFAEVILLPYLQQIRDKLDIPELPAIILHDVHASHRDEALLKFFHDNNCHVRFVPANLTSELQPNDQLINLSFKSKLMHEYEDFYTSEFIRQF